MKLKKLNSFFLIKLNFICLIKKTLMNI